MVNPILDALRPWNAHWAGGNVSELVLRHANRRTAVPYLIDDLLRTQNSQWNLLAGPRQIGKTTSLGHVASALINTHNIPPRSIAIVPLDQPTLQKASAGSFEAIVAALGEVHAATRPRPLFLLVDEVQEIDAWAKQLKAAWDRFHPTVRLLATGSSAMKLIRPADADFPGRIATSSMHPMKFREVVLAHPEKERHAPSAAWLEIETKAKGIRALLGDPGKDTLLRSRLQEFHEFLQDPSTTLPSFLRETFTEFVVWGGYPQARAGVPRTIVERRSVFEQAWNAVLARDAPEAGVKKPREFSLLFAEIAANPGMKFVAHALASDLGAQAATLATWKRILEDAMLVQQLSPLKPNLRPTKAKDKAYPMDPGWYAFIRGITDATQIAATAVFGLLVETVLVDHARRLQFNIAKTTTLPIGYVTEPEIDVAARLGRRWLLLEAKYRNQPRRNVLAVDLPESELTPLRVIATREHFQIDDPDDALQVPAHEWALIA